RSSRWARSRWSRAQPRAAPTTASAIARARPSMLAPAATQGPRLQCAPARTIRSSAIRIGTVAPAVRAKASLDEARQPGRAARGQADRASRIAHRASHTRTRIAHRASRIAHRGSRIALVLVVAAHHPRNAEAIPDHTEGSGPEGLVDRHRDLPALAEGGE